MKYTLEIEEAGRTLEFQLDVECKYQYDPGNMTGAWEDCYPAESQFDVVSVDWDSIEALDKDGCSLTLDFDKLFDWYKPQIQNILEQDEKLFEAWKKHMEDI